MLNEITEFLTAVKQEPDNLLVYLDEWKAALTRKILSTQIVIAGKAADLLKLRAEQELLRMLTSM